MNRKIISRLVVTLLLLATVPTCTIYGKRIMHPQNNRVHIINNKTNNNYNYRQRYLNRNRQDLDVNTHNLNWVNNKLYQNRKNHVIVHHLRVNRHGLLRSIRRDHHNISNIQHQYVPQTSQIIVPKYHNRKHKITNNISSDNNKKLNTKIQNKHVKKYIKKHSKKHLTKNSKHKKKNHKQKANANEILAEYVKIGNNNLFNVTTCNTL